MKQIDWRGLLARLPLPMLALAASYGVYNFSRLYVPTWVAIIQAAAFETTYLGLAAARGLTPDQRKRATAISAGAVVVSIIYNSLDGVFARNPAWLAGLPWYAEVAGAIIHGAPLAAVAFLVADLLLHSTPAPPSRRPAQLRALVRVLARSLRNVRTELRTIGAMLAQAQADRAKVTEEAAQLRAEHAQIVDESAQAATAAAQAQGDVAQLDRQLAQERAANERLIDDAAQARAQAAREAETGAQVSADLAHARAGLTHTEGELAHARAAQVKADQQAAQLARDLELAQASAGLDVLRIARVLGERGMPLREIGALLGVAESTLRARLKASTNGHAIEA